MLMYVAAAIKWYQQRKHQQQQQQQGGGSHLAGIVCVTHCSLALLLRVDHHHQLQQQRLHCSRLPALWL
jgi:hypothetical protein